MNQREQFDWLMDPALERGEWRFVWKDAGTSLVKKHGGLKRHEWCVDNWGFASKEVCLNNKSI